MLTIGVCHTGSVVDQANSAVLERNAIAKNSLMAGGSYISIKDHRKASSLLLTPLPAYDMTATEDMEGQQAKPVSAAAAAGSIVEQPPQDDDNEARKKSAVTIAVCFGTVLQLKYAAESLADNGDEPALLVLELSTWLSFLLYLWAVYVARVLVSADRRRRLGVRPLLAVLAAIVAAVVASVLAYTTISAVVGMVIMYLVTLCVAGFFAWTLCDYLQTRNSDETASTSSASGQEEKPVTALAPDESKEALLQKKSSSKPNLNVGDLEAGLLLSPGA